MIKKTLKYKKVLKEKLKSKLNRSKRNMIKTYIKKFKSLVLKKDKINSIIYLRFLQKILDKLSSKGYIHYNKASRYKSFLYKMINNI